MDCEFDGTNLSKHIKNEKIDMQSNNIIHNKTDMQSNKELIKCKATCRATKCRAMEIIKQIIKLIMKLIRI